MRFFACYAVSLKRTDRLILAVKASFGEELGKHSSCGIWQKSRRRASG